MLSVRKRPVRGAASAAEVTARLHGAPWDPYGLTTPTSHAAIRLAGIESLSTVTNADGVQQIVVPLTLRCANSDVDHGFERQALIEGNLAKVRDAMAMRVTEPGSDLLDPVHRDGRVADRPLKSFISGTSKAIY